MARNSTTDRSYLPDILKDVELKNEQGPIYIVARDFDAIQKSIREYEIANTVYFVKTRKVDNYFNTDNGNLLGISLKEAWLTI